MSETIWLLGMLDSQRYPCNMHLVNNINGFLGLIVFQQFLIFLKENEFSPILRILYTTPFYLLLRSMYKNERGGGSPLIAHATSVEKPLLKIICFHPYFIFLFELEIIQIKITIYFVVWTSLPEWLGCFNWLAH